MTIQFSLDAAHRRCIVGGEPMLFHCHHYNTYLQRSIQDATWLNSDPFLIGAAAEVSHAQLTRYFIDEKIDDSTRRKAAAEELYRWAGFGVIDLSQATANGGRVPSPNSHYAMAWLSKFKTAEAPVCHFAQGWITGAVEAIYNLPPGTLAVSHDVCCASGAEHCVFELTCGTANYTVFAPIGVGPVTHHKPIKVEENPVDYEGIFKALTGMEIVGDQNGNIDAFGVYLTRQYANYYNRISFEFLRRAAQEVGDADAAREIAEPLLIEAGHVCTFNTFGGIMKSPEWAALIKPSLQSKSDWVHAMTAAVNALGWGRWQVNNVSEAGAQFTITDDYESIGYLGMYGQSKHPVSYLAQGAAMGILDLVYIGNIEEDPELTPAFYDKIFRGPHAYGAKIVSSQAMGSAATAFEVHDVVALEDAAE